VVGEIKSEEDDKSQIMKNLFDGRNEMSHRIITSVISGERERVTSVASWIYQVDRRNPEDSQSSGQPQEVLTPIKLRDIPKAYERIMDAQQSAIRPLGLKRIACDLS